MCRGVFVTPSGSADVVVMAEEGYVERASVVKSGFAYDIVGDLEWAVTWHRWQGPSSKVGRQSFT